MTNDIPAGPLAIRAARQADHATIAVLLSQLGYESTPTEIEERWQALSASPDDRILVAVSNGEVAGCISLHALPLFHTAGCLGRITSLVVDERYRSSGIGTALIAAAQAWFEAVGCVKVEVTSADHRAGAHRFYERHGFVRDGQRFTRTMPN